MELEDAKTWKVRTIEWNCEAPTLSGALLTAAGALKDYEKKGSLLGPVKAVQAEPIANGDTKWRVRATFGPRSAG